MVRTARLAGAVALAALAVGCGGSGDGGTMSPPGVTLLDVQTQVFGPRCALSGCHVGPGAPFSLDLSSVSASSASLIGVSSAEVPTFQRVVPGDAADSYLFMKITADPRILGDPMPLSGGALGAGDIERIRSWIDGGAN